MRGTRAKKLRRLAHATADGKPLVEYTYREYPKTATDRNGRTVKFTVGTVRVKPDTVRGTYLHLKKLYKGIDHVAH